MMHLDILGRADETVPPRLIPLAADDSAPTFRRRSSDFLVYPLRFAGNDFAHSEAAVAMSSNSSTSRVRLIFSLLERFQEALRIPEVRFITPAFSECRMRLKL